MGTNVAWKWEQLTNMFKQDAEEGKKMKKGQGAGKCTVFGSKFLRSKVDDYARLMGA